MALQNQGDSQFTVFIRLPFTRGDFVDPPPVEWNAEKDQTLWDILSRPSKSDGIDWKELADNFQVTLQFLLQQAAWLYDRQLSQVRAQMRKVPTTHSNSPSPAPPSVSGSAVGQPPKGPSTAPRAPSRLATQTDAYPQRAAGSRRASSSTTVNQTRGSRAPSRNETPRAETKEPQWEGYGRPSMNRREQPSAPPHKSPTLEEEEALSSSSSEESDMEDESANKKPARFKRFGRFSTTQRPGLRDDEEDEDDSPAFLPLSREQEQQPREKSPGQDLSATLRLDPGRRRTSEQQQGRRKQANESSTSSASSGVPVHLPESEERRPSHVPHGLSPRRAAELAGVSPRRSTASGKSASDDTPSMGSSFSDLDDASVTQSALEEALMSNMQHGGMASRMSTLSQALRSRYL